MPRQYYESQKAVPLKAEGEHATWYAAEDKRMTSPVKTPTKRTYLGDEKPCSQPEMTREPTDSSPQPNMFGTKRETAFMAKDF